MEPGDVATKPKSRLNDVLLIVVLAAMLALLGMVVGLYALPGQHLEIPEMTPGVRVTRVENIPVGASRVVNWGDRIILVIRSDEQRYFALQGTSPLDGCVLDWDLESQRVASPCNHLVFDLFGNVVKGLATTPLQRFRVFIRSGIVYVGREL